MAMPKEDSDGLEGGVGASPMEICLVQFHF